MYILPRKRFSNTFLDAFRDSTDLLVYWREQHINSLVLKDVPSPSLSFSPSQGREKSWS